MTWVQGLFLGVVQGLTEFLPISSSGHLVILQQWLGIQVGGDILLGFDLVLHFGTLLAVVAVFYREVGQMTSGTTQWLLGMKRASEEARHGARLTGLILLGTLPAAVIGLAFKSDFEKLFTEARTAGLMLIGTGVILWSTRLAGQGWRVLSGVRLLDVVLVGLAQAFAILPGISRSGTTIAMGLFCRWDRELAARYSFLLAIPAIAGGMILQVGEMPPSVVELWPVFLVGMVAAAVSGFFAIHCLLRVVRRGQLSWFAYYCWAVGIAAWLYF